MDDIVAQVIAPHELLVKPAELVFETGEGDSYIQVFEWQDYRWLQFGSPAVQSVMHLQHPHSLMLSYLPLMLSFRLFLPQPEKLLLLGLGGGALVRFLRKHLPALTVTTVDKHRQLMEICRTYFSLPEEDVRLKFVVADAIDAIRARRKHSIELMMVDLYGRESMPFFMYERVFYEQCRACLTCNGMLVVNLLVRRQDELAHLLAILRRAFDGQCLVLEAKNHSNVIILAFAQVPDDTSVEGLRLRADALGACDNFDFPQLAENILATNPIVNGRLPL